MSPAYRKTARPGATSLQRSFQIWGDNRRCSWSRFARKQASGSPSTPLADDFTKASVSCPSLSSAGPLPCGPTSRPNASVCGPATVRSHLTIAEDSDYTPCDFDPIPIKIAFQRPFLFRVRLSFHRGRRGAVHKPSPTFVPSAKASLLIRKWLGPVSTMAHRRCPTGVSSARNTRPATSPYDGGYHQTVRRCLKRAQRNPGPATRTHTNRHGQPRTALRPPEVGPQESVPVRASQRRRRGHEDLAG